MGVSTEIWRTRIGSFQGKKNGNGIKSHTLSVVPAGSLPLLAFFLYILTLILLVIGNVEVNPGPGPAVYPCGFSGCTFQARSTGDHIHHQRFHAGFHNYRFVCPLPTCHASFATFANVSSHISQHTISRHQVTGEVIGKKCQYCDKKFGTLSEICQHLKKQHLKNGEEVSCPIPDCSRMEPFTRDTHFASHLSLYHPGWRQIFSTPTENVQGEEEEVNPEQLPESPMDFGNDIEETDFNFASEMRNDDSDFSDHSGSGECNNYWTYDATVKYIANFYALLEGKLIVPSTTVDVIAQQLSFLSEILQNRQRENLKGILKSVGISDEVISSVNESMVTLDPFFYTHHKTALGSCMLTSYLRKKYYKENFKYVAPIEINLKKNTLDREETFQYVDIRETVRIMLEDPTVQREVDESFECELPDGSIVSDYTSGTVFRDGSNPRKRIDLLFFMDAFNCVNPLGSAKTKYKINGLYMTLGNVKAPLRSYLKSMRLVLMVEDSLLKQSEQKYKHCFQKLIKHVKELEETGVSYKGEMIPVRLQFFQGDSLGQHTVGGFVECFSGNYFCRFCDVSKSMYDKDKTLDKPVFQMGNWRTPLSFEEDLRMKIENNLDNCRGVKRESPFNKLSYFKACDPRLSPCLAHDLFIGGVIDCDTASMIAHFVNKKWFTYDYLKKRIRRFHYVGNDARNKPAEVVKGKKKLGGHAIQNWTLFRLLPFIIEGKIKPDDKKWKLYLLLKSILEFVCAPALSTSQIEHLRTLIKKYMMKRKKLKNKYKPKHHFFMHYADLFLKFGALIYHWTLGFEHFHQYFKKVARICGNFINVTFTLASKFQIMQAYQNMGNLYPLTPVLKDAYPLVPESYEGDLKNFLKACNFSATTLDVKCIEKSNINYRKGMWLLLGKDEDHILVGNIEVITSDGNSCQFVVLKYKAFLWQEYGVHWIEETDSIRCVVDFDKLGNPSPHSVYKFYGYNCFSLKHVFVDLS